MIHPAALFVTLAQSAVEITRYDISPSGTHVAIADAGHSVWIVGLMEGQPSRMLGTYSDRVTELEFKPDGSELVAACMDGKARVFDVETGEEVACLEAFPGGGSCRRPGAHASWSKDGRRLLTSGHGQHATLWNARERKPIRTIGGDTEIVEVALWSPDSRQIVTATDDRVARLWDARTGEPRSDPVRVPTLELQGLALAPDGRRLAVCCSDARARVLDMATGKIELTLSHKDDDWFGDLAVGGVEFSPDGAHLLTTSYSFHAVRSWDTTSGREEWRSDFEGGNEGWFSTAYSADGNEVFMSRRGRWVDAKTGRTNRELPDSCIVFHSLSTDGRFVSCVEYGAVVLRDAVSLEERYRISRTAEHGVTVRRFPAKTGSER